MKHSDIKIDFKSESVLRIISKEMKKSRKKKCKKCLLWYNLI